MHALRRPLAALLLFGLAAAGATWANAQNQLASDDELYRAYSKASATFGKLRNGEKEPQGKADQEALDAMAKWFVYRFASSTVKSWGGMEKLRKEFVDYQLNAALGPDASKKNAKFREQFGASLAPAYRAFFENDFQDYRFQIVNLAPTLVDVARLRSEAFADFLAELIADHDAGKGSKGTNKHDVIKLHAIRGLREYYAPGEKATIHEKTQPARPIVPVDSGAVLGTAAQKKAERDVRYVNAILKFADNRPGVSKRPPEEQEAVRVLRREAIETLAATQAPLVVFDKKKVEAPIATLLLRVLSPKSDLEPPPSMAEKVEAAIGICRMKYKNVEAYQPDIGVYLVGQLLADFMTEENKDVAVIITNKKPAAMLWRIDAKRLELALKDMVVNAKDHPGEGKGPTAADKARTLEGAAAPMLREMGKGKTVQGINAGELTRFRKTVATLRPKSDLVFKDIPQSKIDLGD